ncbi:hypothetical protein [Stenotrophomonas sp. JAG2]|uniref:hypothetical protein n=1 Tax=Stenotrophomonas sp. JAG2 TaxID=3229243 RepID=UPI0034E2DE8A
MLDAGWPDYEMIGDRVDKQGVYADLLSAARAQVTLANVQPLRNQRTTVRPVAEIKECSNG